MPLRIKVSASRSVVKDNSIELEKGHTVDTTLHHSIQHLHFMPIQNSERNLPTSYSRALPHPNDSNLPDQSAACVAP